MEVHGSEMVLEVNTRVDESRDAWRALAVASAGTSLLYIAIMVPLTTVFGTVADLWMGSATQAWVISGTNLGIAAGLLSSRASWRLPYLAVGMAMLAIAGLGLVMLSEFRPVDVWGALLLGLGVAALMAGLVEGRLGWGSQLVILLLTIGLLLWAFVLFEHHTTHPMLDPSLLSSPDFSGAMIADFAAGLGTLSFCRLRRLV